VRVRRSDLVFVEKQDVGANAASERGPHRDDAGSGEGASGGSHSRPRAPEEEERCAHGAVPPDPEEDRDREGVHGRHHENLVVRAHRGQVRRRRQYQARRPRECPGSLPPRPLAPGERRRCEAPEVRVHLRRRRQQERPHRTGAGRPAGAAVPRRLHQGHRGSGGARLASDLVPHSR